MSRRTPGLRRFLWGVATSAFQNSFLGVKDGAKGALLEPARDLLAAGLWFAPFVSRNVAWRGKTLRITRGSRLVPVDEGTPPSRTTDGTREARA